MSEDGIAPGTVLAARYQVRRELGRGGMGIVYLCRDLVADARVALKLLSRPGSSVRPEDAWWFHEEARALAGLSHPVIVRARDFGALPDGTPYLVMDAVPGRSLHEWIYLQHIDGLLPWPIIWNVVDQVLGALAHAHARGVIHGDLKPSNVLLEVSEASPEPTVHVLDLGLAWLFQDRVDHRLDGRAALEPTVRWGAGTPGWMAPEQIRLATPHIGPATDLYALGCILFALLTDREPYAGSSEELLSAHRNAPIPLPDPLPPGAPKAVGPFVQRLLAKRPWHRFDFAGDARRIWRTLRPTTGGGDVTSTPLPRGAGPRGPLPSSHDPTLRLDPELYRSESSVATTTGLLGMRPSPFVARQAERARLLSLVGEVANSPTPTRRLILLRGEAGVGKSRLAEWLCEEVHERALMVPLRARYRKIAAPLDGVVGAVTQHYRLERGDKTVVEKVLMNLWGVAPENDEGTTWVAAAAEWLKPGGETIGPTGKRFTFGSPELRWRVIRKTLEHIGEHRPILLWMDDLHLASPTTFEGLRVLEREAQRLGMLVVATARDEAVETDPNASRMLDDILRAYGGEVMRVSPLDESQTFALLRETLPLDDAAATEAAARAKGNPLFALQLLYAWAQGGHFQLREGRYVVPRAALEVRAATTAELWQERLAAIPPPLRPAALAAAALGGDIRTDVLRAELVELGLEPERSIGAMKRAQILLASGSERLRWPHALLQEHLLAQLFEQPEASRFFRAAAEALSHHPLASSRRVVRHRVTNLVRAGDLDHAAELLHASIATFWGRTRDASATLRDLALLDGKLGGTASAVHRRWRAEALRHAGRLEDARREAEQARAIFSAADDLDNEAHCLRLLGHIASDLAAPAHGRRLVARALGFFEELGNAHGRAQCEVVMGEIDYLVGEHASARSLLASAALRFQHVGDRLGRAQCLLLQSFVEQAGGSPHRARDLALTARADFDGIGYRLGVAQSDCALAHTDHREGTLDAALHAAHAARQSFRDLANPRGEAACERLLAMARLDSGDPDAAEEHARAACSLFEKLSDPWGQVEAKLLLAQVALDRGDSDGAREQLIACEAASLVEAEPKQHRHLTLAWLAYHEGRFVDAARELDHARSAFREGARTGDHAPQLLERFQRMGWPRPAGSRVNDWLRAIANASAPA
jgi:serine/threonine protein kinase